MNKKATKWVVITGLDGSGKTSLVSNIVSWLEEKDLKVLRDRFPHDEYLVKKLLDKSKDSYTDRLLFALDNRLFGTEIKEVMKSNKYDFIVTQRGFLDSFVHGSVQGYSYSLIEELNHLSDMPKCTIMIHLVCDAQTAYLRICNDPEADKFEYPAYMTKQERETRRAFTEVSSETNQDLEHFKGTVNFYVDTTQMTIQEVFEYVKLKLEKELNL